MWEQAVRGVDEHDVWAGGSRCVLLSVCRASGFDFLWGDVVSDEGSRTYGEALCDA